MWSLVNSLLNTVFDLWLLPFKGLSPTWQICAIALPVTIFALLVFRYVSDQQGIAAAKDKLKAFLLELRLFKDDLGVTFRAQGQIFRYALIYMFHALLPMSVMIVPIVLVMIQVESRYAFRSLTPGESTILTVTLNGQDPVTQLNAELSLQAGLIQETPALRINKTGEILWRIRAIRPGEYQIKLRIDGQEFEKHLAVGADSSRLSPARYQANDLNVLLYPAEPALRNEAGVSAIHLSYPRSRAVYAGLSSASWILFGASLIFGYALRGLFGVTF